jgi:hypothetical protein
MKKLKHQCSIQKPVLLLEKNMERHLASWQESFPEQYQTRPASRAHRDYEDDYKMFVFAELARKTTGEQGYKITALNLLQQANEFSKVHYQLLMQPNKRVDFTVQGVNFTTTAPSYLKPNNVDTWVRSLGLSIMLRDDDTTRLLVSITPAHLNGPDQMQYDFDDDLCLFLSGIFDKNANMKTLLLNLMKSIESKRLSADRKRHINLVLMPVVMVWVALLDNKPDDFEQAIISAAQGYYEFFKKPALSRNPWGIFPPLLIAAAVIGHDQYGYKLQHDTPYIPTWIMEGDFDK